jgi:hypothetical protein
MLENINIPWGLFIFFLFIFLILLLDDFLEAKLKVDNPLMYPVFIIILGVVLYGAFFVGGDSSCQGFGPGTWCD